MKKIAKKVDDSRFQIQSSTKAARRFDFYRHVQYLRNKPAHFWLLLSCPKVLGAKAPYKNAKCKVLQQGDPKANQGPRCPDKTPSGPNGHGRRRKNSSREQILPVHLVSDGCFRPFCGRCRQSTVLLLRQNSKKYIRNMDMVVQSDQDSEFKGAVTQLCRDMNIKAIYSRPYQPQSQGKVE